jgi:hypothetical protein
MERDIYKKTSKFSENVTSLLHNDNVSVLSITNDGKGVKSSMEKALGANANFSSPKMKFFFGHPVTNEPIWILADPCHMLKYV